MSAVGAAFGAAVVALGPAAVAAPSAMGDSLAHTAPVAGQLLPADGVGQPDASPSQRAAAELAASSALAHNPPVPTGSSDYVKAGGMGELAVATGHATTASADAPNEPAGVTLAPVFETELPSQIVNYDGHNFSYTSIQNGRAEIVGSTTVGQDQQVIIVRTSAAPTSYAFRLTPEQIAAGSSVRLSNAVAGGAEIVLPGGEVIGTVSKPWARTAKGAVVPTSFSISNGKLVQEITTAGLPASAFPVTADPSVTYNCGYITCTWYFSVTRTAQLANETLNMQGTVAVAAPAILICNLISILGAGVPGLPILLTLGCGVTTTALAYSYASNLGDARKHKRCFTISSPPRGPFGSVPLSNKYCHRK